MNAMLLASLAFAAGIAAGVNQVVPWPVWAAVTAILALGALLASPRVRQKRLLLALYLGTALGAGGLLGGRAVPAAQRMAHLADRQVVLTGRPVPGSFSQGQYGSLSFQLAESRGRVRVYLKKWQGPPSFGGLVQVRGKFQPPDGFYNPGQPRPEVQAAANRQGGSLQGEGKDLTFLSREENWQEKIYGFGEKLRQGVREAMAPGDSALLEGMLLGGSRAIAADTLRLFQRCGLSHLLSVSGSHVALFLGLLLTLCRQLRLPRPAVVVLGLGFLLSYTILCGVRPSVCRAALLGAGVLLGQVLDRRADGTAFLGLAAILLLSWHPFWIWDIGFQLSFTAALGLMLLQKPVAERLNKYLNLPLSEALSVPLSAQVFSLPLLIAHFHFLSLVSVIANIILVPLLSVCMAGSALGTLLFTLGGGVLGRVILTGTAQLLGFSLGLGKILSNLPGTQVTTGSGLWGGMLLYFLILFAIFGPWKKREKMQKLRLYTVLCSGISLCILFAYNSWRSQPFSVYFLDVGQGDCALVVTPERETILIDTGGLTKNFDTGERIIVPVLRHLGIEYIDVAILSHGHHDHAGGLAGVARWVKIHKLFLPVEKPSSDVEKAIRIGTKFKSVEIVSKIRTKQTIRLKQCIIYVVEAPSTIGEGGDANESSAVVRVSHGTDSVLFTGDAPVSIELSAATAPIASDVLKVSHHGSRTSSAEAFLQAVHPRLAVISAGRRNRFGHPHQETLDKLHRLAIPVARTDQLGAIKVIFDGNGPEWVSCRWQQEFF
ncbi:DNA internalization-related competence protein ComEC/Rec2 [Acidaminococcus provencensis]|uniref:DNA internalization-related competence protein ComEC/Rec2 n=1 Tax=Acidaminococcus provencensis TaxID=2058289 RepID=UPI0022E5676B|nr:DNA internalization-related competence protein ComEC/Rec2 [Acidaminococcus provencensis]